MPYDWGSLLFLYILPMRKSFLLGMLVVLLAVPTLAGCGAVDEKTAAKNAIVTIACDLMKSFLDAQKNAANMDETALAKMMEDAKNVETKMVDIIKANGFKDKDDFETKMKKYEDDEAYKKEVEEAVKAKCGLDLNEAGLPL